MNPTQHSQLKKLKNEGRLALVCCVMVAVLVMGLVSGSAKTVGQPNIKARAAIAIDAETGQVLYQKNANQSLPVASISKLLSTYIVLEQIKAGKLKWNSRVKIDKASASLSDKGEIVGVPLTAGKTYSVRELYRATLIYSASDAVTALGTKVAGSPHKFIAMMRDTAKQLGLKSTKIVTASGLMNAQVGRQLGDFSAGAKAENTMSAADVAKLSKKLLTDFPQVLNTTRIREAWFDKGGRGQMPMPNWNFMLKGNSQYTKSLPVDGLKTGTSDAGGANVAATVKKNGHRIITVVMHARNAGASDPARFIQTRKLMNWVYAAYQPVMLNDGDGVAKADSVSAFDGKSKTSPIKLAKPTTLWLKKDQTKSAITGQLALNKANQEKNGLKTPVKKGTTVGAIDLQVAGKNVTTIDGQTVTAAAKTTTTNNRANWFVRTWRSFISIF